MFRTHRTVAGLIASVALAGAGLLGTATSASAGGNCDISDFGCNQTGGEFCQDIAMVDPATGDIIGYRNVCEDLTIDWDHETPTCEQANGGACVEPERPDEPVLTSTLTSRR